jgi:hypothetical protein
VSLKQSLKQANYTFILMGNCLYSRWHRLGLAIKGNSATLFVDCEERETLHLNRTAFSRPSNTGIVLVGQRLLDDAFFTGSVQQLIVVPSPDAAYEVCSKYMPPCDKPLPSLGDEEFVSSKLVFQGEDLELNQNRSGGYNNNGNGDVRKDIYWSSLGSEQNESVNNNNNNVVAGRKWTVLSGRGAEWGK